MATRLLITTAAIAFMVGVVATAQNRDARAERFVLDDNNGNTVAIQTATGPITGGTLTIPDPAGAGSFLISTPSSGSQSVSGHLLPGTTNTFDLGSGTFLWRSLFLGSNAQIGGALRLVEPGGSDYSAFVAQAQANNITYTLPAVNGSAGQVLRVASSPAPTSTAATLEWGAGSSGWSLTGNAVTTPGTNFLGTTDNQAFEIHVDEAGTATEGRRRVMRFEPNGTSANIIGGFNTNSATAGAVGATIAGGGSDVNPNRVTDDYGTVGGGRNNRAGDNAGLTTDKSYATVSGGLGNIASGFYSAVGGGVGNTASGFNATVSGGGGITVSGSYSTVGGGFGNIAAGDFSAIPGGYNLTLDATADRSFGFLANNASGTLPMTISAPDVAVFGNTDMWLTNNDGNASELRFFEGNSSTGAFPLVGTNYTAFKAGAAGSQANNITYTLPAVNGSAGQVLRVASSPAPTSTAATLEWGSGSSGWSLTGNASTTPGTNFLGTTDNQAFEIHVDEGGTATEGRRRVMRFEPNATSANIIGGFNGNSVTTGAVGATIAGGGANGAINRVTDDYGVVGGGQSNRAGDNAGTTSDNQYATASGGLANTAAATYTTVSGGIGNMASNTAATVGGGQTNTASAGYTTVAGGQSNTAAATYATVGGGISNTAAGLRSTVSGGENNIAIGDFSAIAGGRGLTLDASALRSFGFHANNSGGGLPMTISTPDVAVFGNTDLWLANNNGAASELRFFEDYNTAGAFPNTANYTAFKAQTQTADITYTLPAVGPTSDDRVLISNGTGTLSWGRKITKATVAKDLASVAANSNSTETFTVTGAAVGGSVVVSPSANLTAGLIIGYARVSASGTVTVAFQNVTGSAIDEGSLNWDITVIE